MKKMLSLCLLITTIYADAQQQVSIQGRINLLSKSKQVLLSGFDPAIIQPDGSFRIEGSVNEARTFLIRTDSSSAHSLWLEPGKYTLECEEMSIGTKRSIVLRTPGLRGPAKAQLFNDFQNQLYSGFGVKAAQGENRDSVRSRQKNRVVQYMDSVIALDNSAAVLASMVRSVQFYVGDGPTKVLIQKLATELKESDEISLLVKDFKRKDKIAAEKKFEPFIMKDTSDNNFSLNSVAGKKAILLDFWASDCGPCRATHPKLINWYQKYKEKGLEIISISIDTEKGKWIKAMRKDGIEKWINISELKGWETSLMKNYFIPFIPFKFLLDENKNIIQVENMATSWIEEKDIVALLDK
ncbi:TlpA family protein disulfide reductase [Niabella hibiscisoli]|uniref:TlpA family protein disulfide reductase n=1 Tax=Niabella hibiscisoli TaxID=1825928 RepID=UPI001F0F9F90|nr:TlpA disulfide reductase family protein [Niabella hibiscisoli]MCH5716125.1 TlpA family protein disulfide reductase [Niabella hibiscisoli]